MAIISGSIFDNNGAALSGAKIVATNVIYSSPTQAIVLFSDASGNYSFTLPSNNTYQIQVASPNLRFKSKIVPLQTTDVTGLLFAGQALTSSNSLNPSI